MTVFWPDDCRALAGFEASRVPISSLPSLRPLSKRTTDRATDLSCITVTTAIIRSARRFSPRSYASRPFLPLRNDGCTARPLRLLQDWLLGSLTLFCLPFLFHSLSLPLLLSLHAPTFPPLHPDFQQITRFLTLTRQHYGSSKVRRSSIAQYRTCPRILPANGKRL